MLGGECEYRMIIHIGLQFLLMSLIFKAWVAILGQNSPHKLHTGLAFVC